MIITINKGEEFSTIGVTIAKTSLINSVLNQALKNNKATKLVDSDTTLLYRVESLQYKDLVGHWYPLTQNNVGVIVSLPNISKRIR